MGNSTKVALVALLIVMVVVVAKFVKSTATGGTQSEKGPAVAGSSGEEKVASKTTSPDAQKAQQANARRAAAREKSPTKTVGVAPASTSQASRLDRVTAQDPARRDLSRSQAGAAASPSSTERASAQAGFLELDPRDLIGSVPGRTETSGEASRLPIRTRVGEGALPAEAGGGGEVTPPVSVEAKERARAEENAVEIASLERVSGGAGSTSSGGESGIAPETVRIPPIGGETRPGAGAAAGGSTTTGAAGSQLPLTYTVQAGDTYWGLAETYYGAGSLCPVIEQANPTVPSKKLRPGIKITIPQLTAEQRTKVPERLTLANVPPRQPTQAAASRRAPATPDPAPKTDAAGHIIYKVRQGDTLSSLAQRYLGDANKFYLIEDLNPDLRWTVLMAGKTIKIPKR